jgi:hypothetical protein
MAESLWRRRAPVWLRIVTGILLFPALWFACTMGVWGLFEYWDAANRVPGWLYLAAGLPACLATWIIVRKSSFPVAVALSALALYALWWILSIIWRVVQALPEV